MVLALKLVVYFDQRHDSPVPSLVYAWVKFLLVIQEPHQLQRSKRRPLARSPCERQVARRYSRSMVSKSLSGVASAASIVDDSPTGNGTTNGPSQSAEIGYPSHQLSFRVIPAHPTRLVAHMEVVRIAAAWILPLETGLSVSLPGRSAYQGIASWRIPGAVSGAP